METTNNFIQIIPKDSLGKVIEFPHNFIYNKSEYEIILQYKHNPSDIQKIFFKMNIQGVNYIALPFQDTFMNVEVPIYIHQDKLIEYIVQYICYLYDIPLSYSINHRRILFGDTMGMNIENNIMLPNLATFNYSQYDNNTILPIFKMDNLLKVIDKPNFSPCIFLNEKTDITITTNKSSKQMSNIIKLQVYDRLIRDNPNTIIPHDNFYYRNYRNKDIYSKIALKYSLEG